MTTGYSHAGDNLAHHAANVAAIAFPLSSVLLHLPETLSIALMVMGLAWYIILFYDRYQIYKQTKTITSVVTDTHTVITKEIPAVPPTVLK